MIRSRNARVGPLGNRRPRGFSRCSHHPIRIGSQESSMCGRYRLSRRKQLIAEYFEIDNDVDWEPRYNIAPSQAVCIIRRNPSKAASGFSLARWGLIPSWAKDASIGSSTVNAPAETVTDKPAYRDAFTS